MTTPRIIAATAATATIAAVVFATFSTRSAFSEVDFNRVFVENFPETQRITGRVSVNGPIPATRFEILDKTLVTLTGQRTATRLIPGGVLETQGFSSMDITIMGQVKGKNPRESEIGALLIPDVPIARDAFDEEEVVLAGLEISTKVSGANTFYFSSAPKTFQISFPRYLIYYFNDGERAVQIQTYVTLSQ